MGGGVLAEGVGGVEVGSASQEAASAIDGETKSGKGAGAKARGVDEEAGAMLADGGAVVGGKGVAIGDGEAEAITGVGGGEETPQFVGAVRSETAAVMPGVEFVGRHEGEAQARVLLQEFLGCA